MPRLRYFWVCVALLEGSGIALIKSARMCPDHALWIAEKYCRGQGLTWILWTTPSQLKNGVLQKFFTHPVTP